MTSPPAPARRRALLHVAALAAAPLAGATALPARAAGPDLSNVTLVLGDQAGGLRALAEAARVLDGVPYRFAGRISRVPRRCSKRSARARSISRQPATCPC